MINETFDFIRYYFDHWPWTPHGTLIDIAITMVPPLLIVGAARLEWRSNSKVAAIAA